MALITEVSMNTTDHNTQDQYFQKVSDEMMKASNLIQQNYLN